MATLNCAGARRGQERSLLREAPMNGGAVCAQTSSGRGDDDSWWVLRWMLRGAVPREVCRQPGGPPRRPKWCLRLGWRRGGSGAQPSLHGSCDGGLSVPRMVCPPIIPAHGPAAGLDPECRGFFSRRQEFSPPVRSAKQDCDTPCVLSVCVVCMGVYCCLCVLSMCVCVT